MIIIDQIIVLTIHQKMDKEQLYIMRLIMWLTVILEFIFV